MLCRVYGEEMALQAPNMLLTHTCHEVALQVGLLLKIYQGMPRGMFESSPLEIQRMVQEQNLVCPSTGTGQQGESVYSLPLRPTTLAPVNSIHQIALRLRVCTTHLLSWNLGAFRAAWSLEDRNAVRSVVSFFNHCHT